MRVYGSNKRRLLNDISCLDEKEGRNGLTSEDTDQREDLKSELERLATLKEISWRQEPESCLAKGRRLQCQILPQVGVVQQGIQSYWSMR